MINASTERAPAARPGFARAGRRRRGRHGRLDLAVHRFPCALDQQYVTHCELDLVRAEVLALALDRQHDQVAALGHHAGKTRAPMRPTAADDELDHADRRPTRSGACGPGRHGTHETGPATKCSKPSSVPRTITTSPMASRSSAAIRRPPRHRRCRRPGERDFGDASIDRRRREPADLVDGRSAPRRGTGAEGAGVRAQIRRQCRGVRSGKQARSERQRHDDDDREQGNTDERKFEVPEVADAGLVRCIRGEDIHGGTGECEHRSGMRRERQRHQQCEVGRWSLIAITTTIGRRVRRRPQ